MRIRVCSGSTSTIVALPALPNAARRRLLERLPAIALAIAAGAGEASAQGHLHQPRDAVGNTDVPAHHGSLLLGTRTLFMYHIADVAPHDYQCILQIELDRPARDAYLKDRQLNPYYNTYTVKPERFVLPDMVAAPRPFDCELYRGNFTNDKGGVLVHPGARATIRNVTYFRKLVASEPRPRKATYVLFGDSEAEYAAHYLTAAPDFDQVVLVGVRGQLLAASKTNAATLIDTDELRNVPVSVSGNVIGVRDSDGRLAHMTLYQQLYMERDYIDKYYDLSKSSP